ncbi:MAG: hypothetical protein ABI988_20640 [Nitrospirota bacterium]
MHLIIHKPICNGPNNFMVYSSRLDRFLSRHRDVFKYRDGGRLGSYQFNGDPLIRIDIKTHPLASPTMFQFVSRCAPRGVSILTSTLVSNAFLLN